MTKSSNLFNLLKSNVQKCIRKQHKQIRVLGPLSFKPIKKVIFKHFSGNIVTFQGRLKNQALFKTAVKFKHFSRSVWRRNDKNSMMSCNMCKYFFNDQLTKQRKKIIDKTSKLKAMRQTFRNVQCLRNYIGTSAFAEVTYLMADVEAKLFV